MCVKCGPLNCLYKKNGMAEIVNVLSAVKQLYKMSQNIDIWSVLFKTCKSAKVGFQNQVNTKVESGIFSAFTPPAWFTS